MAIEKQQNSLSVAGIDLGTHHAAIVVIEGDIVKYGKLLSSPSLAKLWNEIDNLTKHFKLDYISCEQPYYHKNVKSAFVLYEQFGVIKLFCQKNDIEFVALSPSKIKKIITGKGQASKNMVSRLTKLRLHDPDGILAYNNFDLTDAASIALATLIMRKKLFI
ncbi:MAG: crossover junction endodeoxyribonuclease RuvC [Chlorobi bacterium]|nr:crossover junction endodeoxyribonuclease RuvC [Chlorobiota bacterium]